MARINFLPPWVETNLQPAFYDLESGTCLQQTARMYDKVNQLVRSVNEQNETIADYIQQFIDLKDYVEDYFDNLDVQEEINNKLDAMVESGEFQQILDVYVMPAINDLNAKVDNNYERLDGKIDRSVEILNTEIQALTSNSPIPVASIDDMTDTTKIYVLTSSGKWYYYNGEEWTIGGDYQSAQSTDDVAGLIYNAMKQDLKYLLDWELGSISTSGDVNNDTRIRTRNILQFTYDVYLPYTQNVRAYIFNYDENGDYVDYENYPCNPNKGYYIKAGRRFRIYLDYDTVPEGGRPTITDPYASYLFTDFACMSYEAYCKNQISVLNDQGILENPDNLKYQFKWIVGDASNASHGIPFQSYNAYRRMIMADVIKADEDLVVQSTTMTVGLWTYSDVDSSDYSWGSWKDVTEGYTIPKGTYFRLLLSKIPTSSNDPLYDLYNNVVFKGLDIRVKSAEDVTPVDYNLNVKSINHRGYNTIAPENTLPAFKLSAQMGYTYVECDVRFTSDNVPVILHDRDISRTSNGTGNIDQMTYEQALQYDFGSWKSSAYEGTKIPTLGQFLTLCRALCLIPYIEIKHDGVTMTQDQIDLIINTTKAYGFADKATYLVDNYGILSAINNIDDECNIGYLCSDITPTIIQYATLYKANHEMFIDARLTSINDEQVQLCINAGYPLEVWTVDTSDAVLSMNKYISGVTTNQLNAGKILYNGYMNA